MQDKAIFEIGLGAFAGVLEEFRRGNRTNKKEQKEELEQHLRELSKIWDQRFPGFPESKFPYSSFWGTYRRGVRDEYLKKIIIKLFEAHEQGHENKTIINPACVFGRHARCLASRLEHFKVIGMDIDARFNWCYEHILRNKTPDNYEFRQDNIFNPIVEVMPTAVVFFGACGSVSDAAMDYAVGSNCPYLVCRTCCHDNIGGNTKITKRFAPLNWFFRLKNFEFSRRREKGKGDYFSPKYSKERYPRSETARGLSNSDEFLEVSRNSVDSDICRTIIDLDRYLYLVEHGYNVWYKGELFVAVKITNNQNNVK